MGPSIEDFKMFNIILCATLIICAESLSLAETDTPKCFQYTWIAPAFNIKPDNFNCTKLKDFPCIEPPIITDKPPDPYEMANNQAMLCTLTSSNVCVKYTYRYNGGIARTSAFCGKVIEDDLVPVTSGCYQQRVNSHDREVCACQTRRGENPCNMSVKTKYSIPLIITVLIFTFMKFTS